jgi:hypothetical protein
MGSESARSQHRPDLICGIATGETDNYAVQRIAEPSNTKQERDSDKGAGDPQSESAG